jgi:hypothetical protein
LQSALLLPVFVVVIAASQVASPSDVLGGLAMDCQDGAPGGAARLRWSVAETIMRAGSFENLEVEVENAQFETIQRLESCGKAAHKQADG